MAVLQDRLEELQSSVKALESRRSAQSLPGSSPLSESSDEKSPITHWSRLPYPGAIKLGVKIFRFLCFFATDAQDPIPHFQDSSKVPASNLIPTGLRNTREASELPLEIRELLQVATFSLSIFRAHTVIQD